MSSNDGVVCGTAAFSPTHPEKATDSIAPTNNEHTIAHSSSIQDANVHDGHRSSIVPDEDNVATTRLAYTEKQKRRRLLGDEEGDSPTGGNDKSEAFVRRVSLETEEDEEDESKGGRGDPKPDDVEEVHVAAARDESPITQEVSIPTATLAPMEISSLSWDTYKMVFHAQPHGFFDDVVKDRVVRMFESFRDAGYVYCVAGAATVKPPKLLKARRSIGYSIVNAQLQEQKRGSTYKAVDREFLYLVKGTLQEGHRMIPIYHLDHLSADMDTFIRTESNATLRYIIDHKNCPRPLSVVLSHYLDRGGVEAGIVKRLHSLLVESGGQAADGILQGAVHEYLMFDETKYKARVDHIQATFTVVKHDLESFFGTNDGGIEVVMGASAKPDHTVFLKNGQRRLMSKPVIMESIFGGPVNMDEANMLPYGPTGNPHAPVEDRYNPGLYTSEDILFGFARWKKRVALVEGKPRVLYVVDSCDFLFANDKNGSLNYFLLQNYRLIRKIWSGEVFLLFHPFKPVAVWLHRPFGVAADAQEKMPIAIVVRRCSTAQLTTMVVVWCQEGDSAQRGQMNCSFHDGVLAGYAFEHCGTALHQSRNFCAARSRDIFTPENVQAFRQTDFRTTYLASEEYPSADNLRHKIHAIIDSNETAGDGNDDATVAGVNDWDSDGSATDNNKIEVSFADVAAAFGDDDEDGDDDDFTLCTMYDSDDEEETKEVKRKSDKLKIVRAVNILSSTSWTTGEKIEKIDAVFTEEDKPPDDAHRKIKKRWQDVFDRRWQYALNRVTDDSLKTAVRAELKKKPKANAGNKTSRGKTKRERAEYDQKIAEIKARGHRKKFWVYLTQDAKDRGLQLPEDERKQYGSHPVYPQMTFEGVRETLKGDTEFSIYKVILNGKRTGPKRISRNGAFILCHLTPPEFKKKSGQPMPPAIYKKKAAEAAAPDP